MERRHIYCDKTELVLMFSQGKKFISLNVSYDNIIRIQFEKYSQFRLFRRVPSECIKIAVRNRQQPIVYTKSKEKKYFEEYKGELEKFAKDNKITVMNNL